jgi:hypothetical protein
LLIKGADINAEDKMGMKAIDFSEQYMRHNIVGLINGYFEKNALLPEIDGIENSQTKLAL